MATSTQELVLDRVAYVFGRSVGEVHLTDRFDLELKARPPNDFRLNEFDVLLEDVQQIRAGGIEPDREILTVEDFCSLVDRYARAQPEGWATLAKEWAKEKALAGAPAWRRTIWRLIGV